MPPKIPRLLVVDASILFSFFKRDSARRRLIKELTNRGSKLVSPDFVMEELFLSRERVVESAGINELGFKFLFSLLEKRIETFPKSEYEEFLPEARRISPHGKDDPYFALALSLNSGIWSDEQAFKKQSRVRVFSTGELFELLKTAP
jgi:predicted nucleic acid-binding protein